MCIQQESEKTKNAIHEGKTPLAIEWKLVHGDTPCFHVRKFLWTDIHDVAEKLHDKAKDELDHLKLRAKPESCSKDLN